MLSTYLLSCFNRSFRFISDIEVIPHPKKAKYGGEDSYFITDKFVGVADGVGGWTNIPGGNPAKYSRDLMKYCKDFSNNSKSSLELLEKAYNSMDKKLKGSTTAVVAGITDDKKLDLLNLGDSGLFVFRKNKTIFKTNAQQFSFNFPFQLGYGSNNVPSDADVHKLDAEVGDVLILATDGVWDNLWFDKIEEHVSRALKYQKENNNIKDEDVVSTIVRSVAKDASLFANDRDFFSPFASEALKYGYTSKGGKLDDITVLASIVTEN